MVADNRAARLPLFIEDTFEAGIALTGTEVKSLRSGKATLGEAYAGPPGTDLMLFNVFIPEYLEANRFNHDTKRPRRLLLHRRQINKLIGATQRQGYTVVPLKIYFNEQGRAKVELGLGKGKQAHDKREATKERDWKAGSGPPAARTGASAGENGMSANPNTLPDNLPVPEDDGAAAHLRGSRLPDVALRATDGSTISLAKLKGRTVAYAYPRWVGERESRPSPPIGMRSRGRGAAPRNPAISAITRRTEGSRGRSRLRAFDADQRLPAGKGRAAAPALRDPLRCAPCSDDGGPAADLRGRR